MQFSNLLTSFDNELTNHVAGAPCNNFRGYCDVFQKCRDVDADGPLARLKKLLFNEETFNEIRDWIIVSCGYIFSHQIVVGTFFQQLRKEVHKVKSMQLKLSCCRSTGGQCYSWALGSLFLWVYSLKCVLYTHPAVILTSPHPGSS